MFAPILRLVLIYLALIAAVLAVFNRDRLAGLFSGGGDRPAALATMPTQQTPAVAAPATMAPVGQVDPQAVPGGGSQPVYGSDLQTPTAMPHQTDAAPAAPGAPGDAPLPDGADTAIANAVHAARAAFWAGDIEGAKAQMLALTRAHPDNADLLGELGNLYFSLRDYPGAADAWYRAGLRLIDQGEWPGQRGFLPSLGMIDPEKAADLAARAPGR